MFCFQSAFERGGHLLVYRTFWPGIDFGLARFLCCLKFAKTYLAQLRRFSVIGLSGTRGPQTCMDLRNFETTHFFILMFVRARFCDAICFVFVLNCYNFRDV